jgi:hypothetical protein
MVLRLVLLAGEWGVNVRICVYGCVGVHGYVYIDVYVHVRARVRVRGRFHVHVHFHVQVNVNIMPVSLLYVVVHASRPCSCCMSTSTLHVPVDTACPFRC